MFLSSENYYAQLRELIEQSSHLSLAVAFWGEGAQHLISRHWKGEKLRILCNLGSGGTNPGVISDLIVLSRKHPRIQILALDDLHAKVAIGVESAIVGSANVSVNGLGLEAAECSGWQEAGMLVNNPESISEMNAWFEIMWGRGYEITPKHLAAAKMRWLKNRKGRPVTADRLVLAPAMELRDQGIHVVIFRMDASEQAHAEAALARSDAQRSDAPEIRNAKIDFFEDWPDGGEESLPKKSPLITLYYSASGRLTTRGVWSRLPVLDRFYVSNITNELTNLVITEKLSSVGDFAFSQKDGAPFAQRLKPWVESLYVDEDPEGARCLPLNSFLEWEEIHVPKAPAV